MSSSVRVSSNTVVDGERTVVMTREFKGKTSDQGCRASSSSACAVGVCDCVVSLQLQTSPPWGPQLSNFRLRIA